MSNLPNRKEKQLKQSNMTLKLSFKRLFDIMFSIVALIFLSPLFFIIALLIVIDDGFPVFYKQTRSGINGTHFLMYKFRSMKNEQVRVPSNTHDEYNWENGVPDDFVFKAPNEDNPNITKIGRFIRKYSLDELPQFLNVLKGDMSIVGPRPEIIAITTHYNDIQRKRLHVKPGITGWAQVNGRSEIDHGTKIKLDLYYVNNFSIGLDIKILFKTVTQVITGKDSV